VPSLDFGCQGTGESVDGPGVGARGVELVGVVSKNVSRGPIQ